MSKNKKIKPVVLQVLPEMEHGGVEVGTTEIASELQKQKIQNFVASKGGRMVYLLDKIGVKHFTLPLKSKNPFTILRNAKELEKIIKDNGINIVHARSRAPAWSAYLAAKRAGVVYVTTYHGTYGLGPLGIKKIYNRVMTFGKIVIAISEHIKNHIIEHYKVDPKKIRLIHRCVNINNFSPENVTSERMIKATEENHIPEDKQIITLVGRITRWKGQHLLIEALPKLKNNNYHCLIVGSDQGRKKYREELDELIKKHNLGGRVQFIDHSFDIPALLMISDVVLSTAIEPEAFGRASIEGQAMGKIVLASNIGGSLENLIDGVSGKLFESNNPDSLAEAIDWALSLSNEERKKISNAAIENVRNNFTKQIMCDKTIAVYNEVLKD
ncbi:MAG: glycosyltransferase family 4 protein [Lactobacillaceae bacterium]|jgi:glycosyltransferase involved in cell wall biosynthesis|nr:glycosyltransferase family 4 protein [Lactobacillaceae bacterium]